MDYSVSPFSSAAANYIPIINSDSLAAFHCNENITPIS